MVRCVILGLTGCVVPGPPPGAGHQTEVHTAILEHVLRSWETAVPERCYEELGHIRVWVGGTAQHGEFCGLRMCKSPVVPPCMAACFSYWSSSVFRDRQPGIVLSRDDPRLMLHEALHWASACISGDEDPWHQRENFWDDATDYDTLEERLMDDVGRGWK